jgi:hypothetical protein
MKDDTKTFPPSSVLLHPLAAARSTLALCPLWPTCRRCGRCDLSRQVDENAITKQRGVESLRAKAVTGHRTPNKTALQISKLFRFLVCPFSSAGLVI